VDNAAHECVGPLMSVADQAVSSNAAAESYIALWFQKQGGCAPTAGFSAAVTRARATEAHAGACVAAVAAARRQQNTSPSPAAAYTAQDTAAASGAAMPTAGSVHP